jgi:hypothetical protein
MLEGVRWTLLIAHLAIGRRLIVALRRVVVSLWGEFLLLLWVSVIVTFWS